MTDLLDDGLDGTERLGAVVGAADPIPFDVLQSLRSCFNRRVVGAEVAELVYDSVMHEPVGVRSGSGSRHLTFEGPHVTVEMAVVPERGRIVGQFVPAVPGEVEVRQRSGSYSITVDGQGRFATDRIPKGPVSFRCRGNEGGEAVETVTDWIIL